MKKYSKVLTVLMVSGMALGSAGITSAQPGGTANFTDPAFQSVWARTDTLVSEGKVKRSYYWGPKAGASAREQYDEGPGGTRLVQYFDKGRMEINDPNGDRNNRFFVTNGLLTGELVTGRLQVGNHTYTDRYRADIPVAGDTDDVNAPTYASFRSLTGGTSMLTPGEVITATVNKAGEVGRDVRFASHNVKSAFFEQGTSHNIPDVFWSFLNLSGPITENGRQTTGRLSDPYFYITGLPFTEAFWAKVKIAGKPDTDVLIQLYERRVLTYVPSAPEGWRVQMGNIGQHYYDWRYKDAGQARGVVCAQTPPGKFGLVWGNSTQAQGQLGCPTGQLTPGINVSKPILTFQRFERGHMIHFLQEYTDRRGSKYVTKQIYVLLPNGAVSEFVDGYTSGTFVPTPPVPPPGLRVPELGFGKVWREQPAVREALGWASGPEAAPADAEKYDFEYGRAIYAGAAENRLYALYNKNGLSSLVNSWQMYEVPMQH